MLPNQETAERDRRDEPRRRRIRLSLRSMIAFALWAALLCGWVAFAGMWAQLHDLTYVEDAVVQSALNQYRAGKGQILVSENAITIPKQRYILLRTEAGVAAFILTDDANVADDGLHYRWFFTSDLNGSFTGEHVASGESVVFEHYVPLPNGQENVVVDAGGQTNIRCGPIELEWSSGNHIYLPIDAPMEVAYTDETSITAVRFDDPSLIWCSRRPVPIQVREAN